MALRTSRMLVLLITLALSATVIDLHGGSGQACAQAPGDDPDALVARLRSCRAGSSSSEGRERCQEALEDLTGRTWSISGRSVAIRIG